MKHLALFCGLTATIGALLALVYSARVEIKKLKTEAVQLGYASWQPDKTFKWRQ